MVKEKKKLMAGFSFTSSQ